MRTPTINAGIAVSICIVAIVGYSSWYSSIKTKSAVVADLQSKIEAKSQAATRIASARSTLSQIAGDEAAVQGYFVPETAVVVFINGLEERGRLQNTAVTILSVSKNEASTPPTLVLSLSVMGTFDAVMRTIGAIEYSPYDISLSALSIRQDDKKVWNAELKLAVGSSPSSVTATTTTP